MFRWTTTLLQVAVLHLLHELQIVTSEKVAKDWVFSMPGFVGHRDGRNEIWIATN
jgi:hypothetical protein